MDTPPPTPAEDKRVETARERALEIIRRYAPSTTAETPLERAQRDGAADCGIDAPDAVCMALAEEVLT